MRIHTILAACMLSLCTATLSAQQNVIMIQVLDGYSGVAIARHAVSVSIGATATDAKARKSPLTLYTDARGIILMPLPQGAPGWIQLSAADMHGCQPHLETDSFSLAQIASKGLATPNNCSKLVMPLGPGHFVVFLRELTATERVAIKP